MFGTTHRPWSSVTQSDSLLWWLPGWNQSYCGSLAACPCVHVRVWMRLIIVIWTDCGLHALLLSLHTHYIRGHAARGGAARPLRSKSPRIRFERCFTSCSVCSYRRGQSFSVIHMWRCVYSVSLCIGQGLQSLERNFLWWLNEHQSHHFMGKMVHIAILAWKKRQWAHRDVKEMHFDMPIWFNQILFSTSGAGW